MAKAQNNKGGPSVVRYFRIKKAAYDKLLDMAGEQDRSATFLLNRALEEYLQRHHKNKH